MNDPVNAQDRRRFCKTVGVAAVSSMLGPLAGCSGSPTSPSNVNALPVVTGTRTATGIVVSIPAESALAADGAAALIQGAGTMLLVVHVGPNQFSVLSATCTHAACTINGFSNEHFICPCHGSMFDTTGRVLGGPAPSALRQYAAVFTDGALTISA